MKKIFIVLISVIFPVISMAAIRSSSCSDYCANGTFYYGGVPDRLGVCIYQDKKTCEYGCDGREKCLEGKDCPSKCNGGVYYYDGSFSARTKDCEYQKKGCEYGCDNKGCKSKPIMECDDYCKDGTYYSNGSYSTATNDCKYKNKKECVCDSQGEKCLNGECPDHCLNGTAYFGGTLVADEKCQYKKVEKCANGCDEKGGECLECGNRCYNGNYYSNGNAQTIGPGKKACVFEEKICDAGCDENEGCLKCQKDADCAGKSVCKNGTILGGWCTAGLTGEQLSLFGSDVSAGGCAYNLIGSCPSGVCNPIYKDMCGITIGPAVYEDLADGKIKPIPGVKVSAVWKNSSGSENLAERVTDETGHVYFSDEEKYKYFPDKNASLEIVASIENSGKGFQISPVAQTTITRIIEVGNTNTYKVNLVFGDLSDKNKLNIFFGNGESEKEKEKEKVYNTEYTNKVNEIASEVIKWFKDIFSRP